MVPAPAATNLARALGQAPRVIRVMDSGVALANKLAAWNERRLLRDLYDGFLFTDQFATQPDLDVLDVRLRTVESRLPQLKRVKRISRTDFAEQLRLAVDGLSATMIQAELGSVLPSAEIPGLELRIPAAIRRLAQSLS
jgi:predicted nucleotidyltransferase component of viral defense system